MGPVEDLETFDRKQSWVAVYQKIRSVTSVEHNFSFKDSKKAEYKGRNRYADVSPYDHSRVKLIQNDVDYINASLVKSDDANRSYILTQGPLPETCGHFWLMVWEQKSTAILMLNKIIEKGHVKCHKYYPSGENMNDLEMTFKDVGLKVKFIDELESNKDFVVRLLELQKLKAKTTPNSTAANYHGDNNNEDIIGHDAAAATNNNPTTTSTTSANNNEDDNENNDDDTRQILQFHYMSWPDFGCPDTPTDFLNFLFTVRKYSVLDNPNQPPIIHCSAGIGRSGTFCLVDTCLILAEKQGSLEGIDILGRLLEMRKFRMGLIQTPDQLRFSFVAIVKGAQMLRAAECGELPDDGQVETNGYEEDDEGEEDLNEYEDDDEDDYGDDNNNDDNDDDNDADYDVSNSDDENDVIDDDEDDNKFQHLNSRRDVENIYQQQQQQQKRSPFIDDGDDNDDVHVSVSNYHPAALTPTKIFGNDPSTTTTLANSCPGNKDDDYDDDKTTGENMSKKQNGVLPLHRGNIEKAKDGNDDDDASSRVITSHENLTTGQAEIRRRKHDERVKRTQEMLNKMRIKQQEAESSNNRSHYFIGALSLAVAIAGVVLYRYLLASE